MAKASTGHWWSANTRLATFLTKQAGTKRSEALACENAGSVYLF